jgi:hypothetical protein
MSTQFDLIENDPELDYDKIECSLCGEMCLDGEAHGWADQRQYLADHGERLPLTQSLRINGYGRQDVCDDCQEQYVYCDDISAYEHADYAIYIDSIDQYVTESYAQDHFYYDSGTGEWSDEPPSVMLDYGEKVTRHFSPSQPFAKRLVMGIELECEAKDYNSQEDLVDAVSGPVGNQFICKEDSSLDVGMELCTMPFTLQEHKSCDYVRWDEILPSLQRVARSGANTTNCGMHIHINRRALTQLTIGKMLVFANSGKNEHYLQRIFQRGSCSYAAVAQKTILDGKRGWSDRCERINLCPSATIEIRAFRGNLRRDRVMKNIEFTHAMVMYCRDCSMRDVENWGMFTAYVGRNKKLYSNLWAYLNEFGIVA